MIYQVIGILIGIFAIILSLKRFKDGKISTFMVILWNVIWIIIILISIYPPSTTTFANIIGIGRGLDLILILGLLLSYYLIFKIYTMIENIEREITILVRQIALQNPEKKGKTNQEKISINQQRKKLVK
jgi:hypothetical protein